MPLQEFPDFPKFRPTQSEVPMFRVRFTDPNGQAQHITYMCSWDGWLSLARGFADAENADETAFMLPLLADSLTCLLEPMGCELQGIDHIELEFQSL